MRLKGWFIDGFGVFRDYEVNNLPNGLTVFAGPNEAGKSTLLAFLRGMLFGFPDGRSREPRHLPLRGGRHGGRLLLDSSEGEYIVERYVGSRQSARLTLPSGRPASDVDLARLLGGADDRLYRSVFAFSLTELQSFDSLSAEGVRDRIFSAGIAGAGQSSREASRQLRTRAAALLKARGQATVNDLIRDLEELAVKVEDARRGAAQYSDRQAQEETCSGEIERLALEIDTLGRQRSHDSLLVELWPLHEELEAVTAELEALGASHDYPPQAEANLARLVQEIESAGRTGGDLSESRERVVHRRASLELDSTLPPIANEVEQLYENVALQRSLLHELPAVRQKVQLAEEALGEKLGNLGPDWSASRVEAFDGSIPTQEEVRNWQDELQRTSAEVERVAAERDTAERHRDEVQQSRDRLAATLATDLPEAEALETQSTILRRLRATLVDLTAAESSAATSARLAMDRDREHRLLEAEQTVPSPVWMALLLATSAVAGAIGAAVLAISGAWSAASLPAMAAVGLGAGAAVLRQQRSREQLIAAQQRENLVAISDELAGTTANLDHYRERVTVLEEAGLADCESLALDFPPSAQALEEREADLDRHKAARQQWAGMQARLTEAEAILADAIRSTAEIERRLTDVERALTERRQEWNGWKRARAIPDTLSPQGVLDYFEVIRVCRGLVQTLRSTQAEHSQLAERIGAWEERARAALACAGDTAAPSDAELVDHLAGLRQRCVAERAARDTAIGFDEELLQIESRIAQAGVGRARVQQSLDDLLSSVAATDEVSFRAGLARYQRRVGLETKLQDLESRLTGRLGRGETAEALRGELAGGEVGGWHQALEGSEARLEELQRERDAAIGQHRDAQRARLDLEASADLATLETETESLRTELAGAVDTWRTTTLARALIDDTLREFERTRQPAVLAEASRTFASITRGRYDRIVQDETARDIAVLDARSGRRPVDALSRGTAEQLYLCIRLALAAEFARRSEPLPLVLDDVFVNFDPERAHAVAQVVAEFAQTHQVLAFTCHPSTRDILLSVEPQAGLVELQPIEPLAAPLRRARGSEPETAQPTLAPEATPAATTTPEADVPQLESFVDVAVRPASGE